MNKIKLFFTLLLINIIWQSNAQTIPWSNGPLKVSSDKHMLQHENGSPFFWLGDTAWLLSNKLDQTDVDIYLANRENKKFNVIQISIDPTRNNTNNQSPFNNGYANPNEAYWQHVDYIVTKAAEKGMYIGLLPTWGERITNVSDAQVYGTWIGNRYKNSPNIIWIIGGDDDPSNNMAMWDALAESIKAVDKNHLMTYHPSGYSSSGQSFHNRSWLDFNMYQSGHSTASVTNTVATFATTDYNRTPTKPTIDGEPRYETIQRNFYLDSPGERFVASDVREALYRHLFAGTFGVTYGHHSIWQFYKGGNDSYCCGKPIKTWTNAINDPGANQMKFLSNLMHSRPILNRVPDQSLLAGASNGSAIIQATKGVQYALIYLPSGEDVTVNMSVSPGNSIKAWWYNPRNGNASEIGVFDGTGTSTFNPPGNVTTDNDWVLVLDDVNAEYGVPGVVNGNTLAVIEHDNKLFKLYPNPVSNILNVLGESEIKLISIFNI